MINTYAIIVESGITLYNMQFLTEKDITDIFGKLIGPRAQFRALVNQYRASQVIF